MKFTKNFWFYETTVNGLQISVQRKNESSRIWVAHSGRGLMGFGTTREKAVMDHYEKLASDHK